MPTFELTAPDGGVYEVDAPDERAAVAAFKKMPPVASEPSSGATGEDPKYGGAAMNTTAGVNEGLYGTLGAPVDLMRGAMNLGIRGVNAATGSEIGTLPDDGFMGSKWVGQTLGSLSPALDPENAEANTKGEKIARGIGQGIGYSVAPEAVVGLLARSGNLTGRALDTSTRVFGRAESAGAATSNAAVGGVSGGGATAAMEAAPDEYKPLAGMAVGTASGVIAGTFAGIAREGRRLLDDAIAPMTAKGQEGLAADRLRRSATDPDGFRNLLGEAVDDGPLVPGSQPTTFQATGDMGVGGLERQIETRNPEPFMQRRADQNSARVGAMAGVQEAGAPEAVAASVRATVKRLDDTAQAAMEAAAQRARSGVDAIGPGQTPDAAGDALRGSLESARAAAKAQERALWNAVDPDGTLAVPVSGAKQASQGIIKEMPVSAKAMEGEEAAVHDLLKKYGDIVPLKELQALQSRLKATMRDEKLASGESPAYRRMSQLNSGIQNDLEGAIVAKVADEAQAVARGEINVENTIDARLKLDDEKWFAERQATAKLGSGAEAGGGFTSTGSSSAVGVSRTAGQGSERSGIPPGDPRLSADAGNFDQAALDRLTTARTATKDRAETFDNKTLAPIRRRPGTTSPYDMPASAVPQAIFKPGAKGFDTVQTFRKAVGDEQALGSLQGYIVDRLRRTALRDDGTLDPRKVEAFRKTHSDALRAFPDLDKRFADAASASQSMADVIASQKASVAEAQKGIVGKVMGLDDPSDVTRTIGGIFQAQDSAQRMLKLRGAIGQDPAGKEGLRKAVVDHVLERFVGNTEAATSGVGTIKSDGFQTFVKKNKAALQTAGFSNEEIDLMQRLADDLQRANRSNTALKLPARSNTAQDVMADAHGDNPSILRRLMANLPTAAGGVTGAVLGSSGGAVGAAGGAAAGAAMAKTIADMRAAGIKNVDDILADALLNPQRARMLLNKPRPQGEVGSLRLLGRLYRKSAQASAAVVADETER